MAKPSTSKKTSAAAAKDDGSTKSRVLKLDCIPYGFFERELQQYFTQFGSVLRVRVPRSKKTGNFKGYAYVMFDEPNVAQVAAEAMDGYLMFDHRIKARVVPADRIPDIIKSGPRLVAQPHAGATQRKHCRKMNATRTKEADEKATKKRALSMSKKMAKLAAMGVEYSLGGTKNESMQAEEGEITVVPPTAGTKKTKRAQESDVIETPVAKRTKTSEDTAASSTPAVKTPVVETKTPAAKKGAKTPKVMGLTPKTPTSGKTPPLRNRLRSAARK